MAYKGAETSHLVMDNFEDTPDKSLTEFYGPEVDGQSWFRLTINYTPKHGSWLN